MNEEMTEDIINTEGDAEERTTDAQGEPQNERALATEAVLPQSETEDDTTQKVFDRDLALVKEAFPECEAESIFDLGEEFFELMSIGADRGLSPVDAYAATHVAEIKTAARREAEKQAAAKYNSKAHLQRASGSASSLAEVPAEIYERYKRLMPHVSDREIREHYNKSLGD